jgi:hypothetical protein
MNRPGVAEPRLGDVMALGLMKLERHADTRN